MFGRHNIPSRRFLGSWKGVGYCDKVVSFSRGSRSGTRLLPDSLAPSTVRLSSSFTAVPPVRDNPHGLERSAAVNKDLSLRPVRKKEDERTFSGDDLNLVDALNSRRRGYGGLGELWMIE